MAMYKQSSDIVTREIAGETMLVPLRGNIADMARIFALDEVSAFIWDLLDGSRGIEDISKAVTKEFDVTHDVVATDTKQFLDDLLAAGLVEKM